MGRECTRDFDRVEIRRRWNRGDELALVLFIEMRNGFKRLGLSCFSNRLFWRKEAGV